MAKHNFLLVFFTCIDCFIYFIHLFISFGLCWVFVAARGLSLVAESGGCSLVGVRGLLIVVASHCRARALGT